MALAEGTLPAREMLVTVIEIYQHFPGRQGARAARL